MSEKQTNPTAHFAEEDESAEEHLALEEAKAAGSITEEDRELQAEIETLEERSNDLLLRDRIKRFRSDQLEAGPETSDSEKLIFIEEILIRFGAGAFVAETLLRTLRQKGLLSSPSDV